jgi:hypothetical protein
MGSEIRDPEWKKSRIINTFKNTHHIGRSVNNGRKAVRLPFDGQFRTFRKDNLEGFTNFTYGQAVRILNSYSMQTDRI